MAVRIFPEWAKLEPSSGVTKLTRQLAGPDAVLRERILKPGGEERLPVQLGNVLSKCPGGLLSDSLGAVSDEGMEDRLEVGGPPKGRQRAGGAFAGMGVAGDQQREDEVVGLTKVQASGRVAGGPDHTGTRIREGSNYLGLGRVTKRVRRERFDGCATVAPVGVRGETNECREGFGAGVSAESDTSSPCLRTWRPKTGDQCVDARIVVNRDTVDGGWSFHWSLPTRGLTFPISRLVLRPVH